MSTQQGPSEVASLNSTVATIGIMKQIINYLPTLTLIVASLLTITFYYVSLQIFFLVTPFMVVYAFGSGQPRILINLLARFFALAIKPIIFVITTVVALLVIHMFEDIYTSMIQPIFTMYEAASQATDTGIWKNFSNPAALSYTGKGAIFVGMLAAMTLMITKIFTLGALYHIIFHGQEIVVGLFGFKEKGIDVQEGIGNEISGDMKRYSKPI